MDGINGWIYRLFWIDQLVEVLLGRKVSVLMEESLPVDRVFMLSRYKFSSRISVELVLPKFVGRYI